MNVCERGRERKKRAGVSPPFGVSKAGCGEWRSSVKLASSTERNGELFISAVSSQCDINNGFPRLKTGKSTAVDILLDLYSNIICILERERVRAS